MAGCAMRRREQKRMLGSGVECGHLEGSRIYRTIILKCVLKVLSGGMWTIII
jgi:hypothetical protein